MHIPRVCICSSSTLGVCPSILSFSLSLSLSVDDDDEGTPEACCSTDLPPLPQAVIFLEESLVMRHAVLAVDEADGVEQAALAMDCWFMRVIMWACTLRSDFGNDLGRDWVEAH